MGFSDIPGQISAKNYLLEIIRKDRIPHSLLFTGPEGVGTLPIALAFAKYLLCINPEDAEACSICPACKKNAKWIHPDLHFTFPTIGAKVSCQDFLSSWRTFLEEQPLGHQQDWFDMIGGEGKQGNITRNECDRILRTIQMKPFEAEKKVWIIWLPEYLGSQGNRLLKIIEEPPENSYFILVSVDSSKVLNTITSRCQIIPFVKLQDFELEKHLVQNKNISKTDAKRIAFLAQGSLNEANRLISDKSSLPGQQFIEWLRLCYVGNAVKTLRWITEFAKKEKESQKNFFRYGLLFLRELVFFKQTGSKAIRLIEAEKKSLQKLASTLRFEQILSIISVTESALIDLERNVHTKILLAADSILIHRIMKGETDLGQQISFTDFKMKI
jgi:DNA polymerase-3 subunit delta'